MTIYGDLISPYVRTCMVVAHELGLADSISLSPVEVRIASVNEELASISPIAQVPVLVRKGGVSLHDSRVIVDYLCGLAETDLLPLAGEQRSRTLTLQAIGLGMADAAVAYRNEVAQRPQELQWRAWLDRQQRRVAMSLDALEQRWIDAIGKVTVGALTVAVTLSYLDLRFGDWRWRDGRPRLSAAHAEICLRRSMTSTSPAS